MSVRPIGGIVPASAHADRRDQRMRSPSSAILYMALEALGVLLISVGIGLWSLPAGLVAAGVWIIVLVVAAELSQ